MKNRHLVGIIAFVALILLSTGLPNKQLLKANSEFKKLAAQDAKNFLPSTIVKYSSKGWKTRKKTNNLLQYNPISLNSIKSEALIWKSLYSNISSINSSVQTLGEFKVKKLELNQSQAFEYFLSSEGLVLRTKNAENSKPEILIALGNIGKETYKIEHLELFKNFKFIEPLKAALKNKSWTLIENELSDFNKITTTVIIAQVKTGKKDGLEILPRSLEIEFSPRDSDLSFNVIGKDQNLLAAIIPTSTPRPEPTPNFMPTNAPPELRVQKYCKVGSCRYMTQTEYLKIQGLFLKPGVGWDTNGLRNYLTEDKGFYKCSKDRDCFAYRCTGSPQACNKVAIENIKKEDQHPLKDNCFVDEAQGFKAGAKCFYIFCEKDAAGELTGYCKGAYGTGDNTCSIPHKNYTVKDPVCVPTPEPTPSPTASATPSLDPTSSPIPSASAVPSRSPVPTNSPTPPPTSSIPPTNIPSSPPSSPSSSPSSPSSPSSGGASSPGGYAVNPSSGASSAMSQ